MVDLATSSLRLPVSGQKTKTSPELLVLTSQPIAVPVVSAPLIWIGVPQAPAGPVRRLTNGRVAVVPAGVDVVLERRGGAVVDPDHLLVGVGLGAGEGVVEGPGGAAVGRLVGPHLEHGAGRVDADRRRPGGAVRRPVDRRVGVEGVAGLQRQAGLSPGGAAVGGVELRLLAAAADVVRGADDLLRVPEVDPDVRLAARDRGRARRRAGWCRPRSSPGAARCPVRARPGRRSWWGFSIHSCDLLQHQRIAAGRIGRRDRSLPDAPCAR